jgi:hypothetical protein
MSRSTPPTEPRPVAQRREKASHDLSNLLFGSMAANVPTAFVRDSPTLMVAALEDLCWRLALIDWSNREPPRKDRARHRAWQAETARLEDKREGIRAMVDEAVMES